MIVNTAIFTCSICGEASSNICAYCTKDACSNHRCERCKRCSDCCECEFPLSAEEPIAAEEPLVAQEPPIVEAVTEPDPELESAQPVPYAPQAQSALPVFLTAAESSVFVEGSVFTESPEAARLDESTDPDFTEPGE